MKIASPDDIAALEWLELELRTADARRPRVADELAQAVSVARRRPGTQPDLADAARGNDRG